MRLDVELISVVQMVVDHGGQQVVSRTNGVEITGQVQVELLHRQHLGIPGASGTALDAEGRAHGGLTQSEHAALTDLLQALSQTDCSGRLAFAKGCGGDGRDDDVFAARTIPVLLDDLEINLGDIAPVGLDAPFLDASPSCHLFDGVKVGLTSNVQIRLHRHGPNHGALSGPLHTFTDSNIAITPSPAP